MDVARDADWVVALPMYNVTPALALCWHTLLNRVVARLKADGVLDRVAVLEDSDTSLTALWQREDLLLSQTCGYPLMCHLPDTLQVVGAPIFDVAGCEGATYRSVLVVSDRAYRNGATTLSLCAGLRAAYNNADSHSGMNAFRDAVAVHAAGRPFFGSVQETGSHIGSMEAIADGQADIAAIDCVTFAYAQTAFPSFSSGLHQIGVTASAPSLPFIASPKVDAVLLGKLRMALSLAISEDATAAHTLRLTGLAPATRDTYQAIVAAQNRAIAADYRTLV
jgi:ABC-type phosphate/phosphonate transport system substrate-binding protein